MIRIFSVDMLGIKKKCECGKAMEKDTMQLKILSTSSSYGYLGYRFLCSKCADKYLKTLRVELTEQKRRLK